MQFGTDEPGRTVVKFGALPAGTELLVDESSDVSNTRPSTIENPDLDHAIVWK